MLRKKRTIITAALALGVLLLGAGCTDNASGLFYSLENERGLNDGALNNNLTVAELVNAGGTYYMAALKGYTATAGAGGNTWSAIGGYPTSLNTADVAYDGTDVYALCYNSSGVYSLYSGTPGSDLSADTGYDRAGYDLVALATANSQLLLAYRSSDETSVDIYAGATLLETIDVSAAGLYNGRFDACWDGTDYWITYGNSLLTGTALSGVGISRISASDNTNPAHVLDTDVDGYGGIHYDTLNTTVYLSTEEGHILSESGGNWTKEQSLGEGLHDFATVTVDGTQVLLVGADTGYYELLAGTFREPSDEAYSFVTIAPSIYNSLNLKSAAVNGFLPADGADSGVSFYAASYGFGLWRNDLASGTPAWALE